MYLFSRNIIYNSQDTEAIHMSINRQLGSEDVAYNGIVLSHKKNEILPFAAKWMDLENIMLDEMSDKEKYYIIYITYMQNLKIIQIKVYAKKKEAHRYRKQICNYQIGEGRGEEEIRGMELRGTNYYI